MIFFRGVGIPLTSCLILPSILRYLFVTLTFRWLILPDFFYKKLTYGGWHFQRWFQGRLLCQNARLRWMWPRCRRAKFLSTEAGWPPILAFEMVIEKTGRERYIYIYVCICVYIYIYIYIFTLIWLVDSVCVIFSTIEMRLWSPVMSFPYFAGWMAQPPGIYWELTKSTLGKSVSQTHDAFVWNRLTMDRTRSGLFVFSALGRLAVAAEAGWKLQFFRNHQRNLGVLSWSKNSTVWVGLKIG